MYVLRSAEYGPSRSPTGQSVYGFWFTLRPLNDPTQPQISWRVGVQFQELLLELISPNRPNADPEAEKVERQRMERACFRFAVRTIEQRVLDGILPPPTTETRTIIETSEADVPLLRELFNHKTCSYQIRDGLDLWCSAASRTDDTAVGNIGIRAIAPTSRAVCRECGLPDTDFICSHLLHPQIIGVQTTGDWTRMLGLAMCDLDRPEIAQAEQCLAGGHACWERIIDEREREKAETMSPFTLPEALDFLDAAWRLVFGKDRRLLKLPSSRSFAELATPAEDRADFDAKLTAFADVLKMWQIPDDLLPDDQEAIQADHTLARAEAAIAPRLVDDEARGRLREAIKVLQAVNGIRVGAQHAASAHRLPASLQAVGIPYPPEWRTAWEIARERASRAIGVIRDLLLRSTT